MNKEFDFHEIEVKFRVDEAQLNEWKQLVEKVEGLQERIYTESDDVYYTKGDEFLRFRFDPTGVEDRKRLTYKKKTTAGNNIIRREVNLPCNGGDLDTVTAFCNSLGFEHNFRINKYVHIYQFDDATLPFYTVIDKNGNRQSFIEIEVNEELIPRLSGDECWAIIRKYERLLEPLGITPQKRLKLSLFEMYKEG